MVKSAWRKVKAAGDGKAARESDAGGAERERRRKAKGKNERQRN